MYLIHSKQIKPLRSQVMHAQSEKTFSLWLQAAQRWPQPRPQCKITWPFCTVEAKSGKDRELCFYKSSGHFVEKWLLKLNSPKPLLVVEVFGMIPTQGEAEELLICWPGPLVPTRQPAIQRALPWVIVQVSGKRTVSDGQGHKGERNIFNFRHGKTMLTGKVRQEAWRHV